MKNTKKVVIVYADKYTSDFILEELKAEGFQYTFKLANELTHIEQEMYIKESDEVWLFGNVERSMAYQFAIEYGIDTWQMA